MSQASTKVNSHEKLNLKSTTISQKVHQINSFMEEVICEYKTSRDVKKTFDSIHHIQQNIESIFDNMSSYKLEEDELEILTVICRKMNEDMHIQEVRHHYHETNISVGEDKTVPTMEDEKKPRDQLPLESQWTHIGSPSSHRVRNVYNVEEKDEIHVQPAETKPHKGKETDDVHEHEQEEEEMKFEGTSVVKSPQKEERKVRSAVNEEPVVEVKPVVVEESDIGLQEELDNIVKNMKEEFGNYKLDETYSWYVKMRDFGKNYKLSKKDRELYNEKLRENKTLMEDIERYDKEAQILVNELESDEGYVLESSKKNFEIKYKMSEGGLVSLKMDGVIDVPLFNFLALIYEMDCYNQWMPFNKESKEIKKITTTSKAGWLKFNIPPPISNREAYVYGVGFNRLEVNGSVLIVAKSFHNDEELSKKLGIDIPATSKLTRVDIHYMGAAIVPVSHDKIKVKMVTKMDPKLKFIPTSVVSWFVRKASSFLLDILVKKATNFKGSVWEQRIKDNTEFYGWLEEEINKYLKLQATQQQRASV